MSRRTNSSGSGLLYMFLGGLLIVVSVFFFFQINDGREAIKSDVDTLKQEMNEITPYLAESKQENVVGDFPFYNKPDKNFLEKEDWELAVSIREDAKNVGVTILNYGTSDVVKRSSSSSDSESSLLSVEGRQASFTVAGSYDNILSFFKEIESSDRYILINSLDFQGNEQAQFDGNLFDGFDKLSSASVNITYYYLYGNLTSNSEVTTSESLE